MYELSRENIKRYAPDVKGVYRIYVQNERGLPLVVNRFCGVDKTGLLYIGQTDRQTLRKRLYNFWASAQDCMETNNHSGGVKYCDIHIIRDTLKIHTLWFNFSPFDTPKQLEKDLLRAYATVYGEYPPLNK
jgi:hypothetical protein